MLKFSSSLLRIGLSASLLVSVAAHGEDLVPRAREALRRAGAYAVAHRATPDSWNMPLHMGVNYVVQYYLVRFWLRTDPRFDESRLALVDEARLREVLLKTQLADGSWQPTTDPNLESGNLDAAVMNYWALKVSGADLESDPMVRARRFIRNSGGLGRTSTFTRLILALFGQMPWADLPRTPLFVINPNNPRFMNIELFPQWVRPHIVPIAYLSGINVRRDLGSRFALGELKPVAAAARLSAPAHERAAEMVPVVEQMLKAQAPLGSWGGYTSATLLTIAALADFSSTTPDAELARRAREAIGRGLGFIDHLYLNENNPAAYLGTVCDGRFWDTILILQGLLSFDSGFAGADRVAGFLTRAQTAKGGIPFGLDFEDTPDLDDTAEFVTTLQLHDPSAHADHVTRAIAWFDTMQNRDGGWGAFDHENTGNFVLNWLAGDLADSANLFDPSTPDVTGHILEAYGAAGANFKTSRAVRRAIRYLRDTVEPTGAWKGRWGVNYIYGTNAAVSGLLRVGVPANSPIIRRAVAWTESRQNPDGGFGESTESYRSANLAGRGISTPSQTAWALMVLVRAGRAKSPAAARAVEYLVSQLSPEGSWTDASVVGTGHAGLVYLNYPSYPLAFPMIALGEYVRALGAQH